MPSFTKAIDSPLILFFALAYGLAWSCVPVLAWIASASGVESWAALSAMVESWDYGDVEPAAPKWLLYFITRIQDFSFSIAGIIMIASLHGRKGLLELRDRLLAWRIGWIWLLLALLPFFFYFLATIAAGALTSFSLDRSSLFTILLSLESGILVTLFLRGPLGEELGLRGFALPRLLERTTAFRASSIIGFFWALWHLPVLIGQGVFSILIFLLLAFVLSFLFTWLFIKSNGSLIPVLLFHMAQNSEEVFETMFPALLLSDWELVSSLLLLFSGVTAAIWLYRKAD